MENDSGTVAQRAGPPPVSSPLAIRRIGLFAAPLPALVCYYFLPSHFSTGPGEWVDFTQQGWATPAMMVSMAAWWMTEAVGIEVTALIPIVLSALFGIASMAKVTQPYAFDVIYLFMGGFVLRLAIERWGLDKRIAFFTLRLTGTKPAAMMVPISVRVIGRA
jgi:sodium-dependent dicarboxylate transporter 2/3/5